MPGLIRKDTDPAVRGFSFIDLEAHARQILADAGAKAKQVVADAEMHARTLASRAQHMGYERGRAEGREAGMRQIRDEARQAALDAAVEAARGDVARLGKVLADAARQFDARKNTLLAQAEMGLIELATAVARRVCKLAVDRSAEPAAANARSLLDLVRHHADVELRVNPDEHQFMQSAAGTIAREIGDLTHIRVVPDENVPRGGCALVTRDGTMDAHIERQLDRVAEALTPAVSARPASTEPISRQAPGACAGSEPKP